MADPRSVSATDIKLEPMVVKIGGTNYGVTDGGVTLTIEHSTVEQRCDQYDGPLNTWFQGIACSATFTLLETDYTLMSIALLASTLRSTGGTAVGIGGKVPASLDAQSNGVTINLHPAGTDDGTLTRDINIWKALATEFRPLEYAKDKVTKFEVTFKGHLDTSKTAGKMLADFGLTAAT